MEIKLMVNGAQVARDVEPRLLLVHFLRDTRRRCATRLDGNLCRSTGYHNIVRAVIDAASVMAATRSEVTA